ncbi:MAG: diguanylate cyclase/phosphodiesterase with PAS/PAC and GAF sensor(s) [Comamonadaceae bacterium]|nr:MAG: diguanylate cyclase/phosphodiesterase with PAS/PAC and GAF sensor(s) [Comamonadaceae bacterium]
MFYHSPHTSRASEPLFRAFFMAMEDGAILHNGSGEIIAINPAAELILGFDATHWLGHSCAGSAGSDSTLNFIHQGGTPIPWEHHPAMLAFQTGKPQRNVLMGVYRPDGVLVWLSVNTLPLIPDGESAPYAVVQTFCDITQQRLTERYEQFRSQTLELLAGGVSLPDLLASIVRGVEQLKPEMICSILLSESDGQHLGQCIAPSLPDFYNAAIDGIEIGVGCGCCGTAAATGERVIVDDIQTHPYWIPYKELAAKAGLAACWSEPIRSSSGQVLGTFAVYHREVYSPAAFDISIIEKSTHLVSIAIERKRMEQDIAAREQEFRSLAETSPDFIVRYDRQGRHRYFNDRLLKPLGL